MRVVCPERSNYRGPSPLRLELREHRLMLKRLKFDKILMRAQWLNSSTRVGLGGGEGFLGMSTIGKLNVRLQFDVTTSKPKRMVLASAKVGIYAVSLKWVLPGAEREGLFHGQRTRISKHLSKARRCFQVLFQGLLARSSWSEVTFASPEKGNGGELSPRARQLISVRSSQFFSRQDKQQLFQPRPQGELGIGHPLLYGRFPGDSTIFFTASHSSGSGSSSWCLCLFHYY